MQAGIAIGGFMGAGKSTVGARVAAALGLPFVDTDTLLATRYGPIATQIVDEGEAVFRARERALVDALVAGPDAVIATGGGLWVDPANRTALRRGARLVVLQAPLDELRRRVGQDPSRPLWDDAVAARWSSRQEAYADADLVVETAGRTPDDVASTIVAWWRRK